MSSQLLRQPAEIRFQDELQRLHEQDGNAPKPANWYLSPRSVRAFILGDEKLNVSRKFYGDDALVDRAIVTLMGKQGLMLVGEPGTAKSMLSELLAAAISNDSGLTIQGTAGTTEDHIKYSWNYALLLAEGPSERSLVPSPLYQGMAAGKAVRFEEITRCPPEIQDVMVSMLSDKTMMLPEMGEGARLLAQSGFNVIATANLRDRGVHEMSAALKRRFNFETVKPIQDAKFEQQLLRLQLQQELGDMQAQVQVGDDVVDVLVTVFQELRKGVANDGTHLKKPDAVMSTAEAVNIAHAASLEAAFLGDGMVTGAALARQLRGVVLKDNDEDIARVQYYVDAVARERAKHHAAWKSFYEESKTLWQ